MEMLHKLDKHVIYLDELNSQVASLLDHSENLNYASRAAEAVLLAVRGHLSFEQSIKFLNFLPLPFKAIYIKNWNVNDCIPERINSMNEFFEEVYMFDPTLCHNDYCDQNEIKKIVRAVFKVIGLHVSGENLSRELSFLPNDLRIYLEAEGVAIKSNGSDSSIWLS